MLIHLGFAVTATELSAAFFVAVKLAVVRGVPWLALWSWSLTATGGCGLALWLALGAPAVPWEWCLVSGLAGCAAHIASNLALRLGEASVLVPLSGAKPLALIPLAPLFGALLPPATLLACTLATVGLALVTLTPARTHAHSPRPVTGILLMLVAMTLMAFSDLCGGVALAQAGPEGRWAVIGFWNLSLGIVPVLCLPVFGRDPGNVTWRQAMTVGLLVGVIFAVFIAALAMAFATAPDPTTAVTTVNVLIACRGAIAILMILALDHIRGRRLEPLPRWIHALRLAGAIVLAAAVALAYTAPQP
jgi:drug/metabolite transporter (DMT)-like permease